MSTDISTDIAVASRPICRPIYVARRIDRYIDRDVGRVSGDISTDYRSIYRSIYRPICRPLIVGGISVDCRWYNVRLSYNIKKVKSLECQCQVYKLCAFHPFLVNLKNNRWMLSFSSILCDKSSKLNMI